jgi:hypothetical protein
MQQQQQQPAQKQAAPQQPAQSQPAQAQPAQSQPAQSQPGAPQTAPAQPRFDPQHVTPVVQIGSPRTTDEVGVADVLVNSFALTGFLIAAALVIGLVTGGIFIAIRRWRDKNAPDGPAEPSATRLKLS